ncbi:MAG: hypothetical protein WAO52_11065 [Prolixibacteraceae bacterium]
MKPITSAEELKNAIRILEIDQTLKEQLLKEQFYLTYESLKPVNLIKSALNEVTTSPYLTDNILGATVGLISGYISKKIAVGRSGSTIRKILGSLLQFGVTNIVAQHTDKLKSVVESIFQNFLHKDEMNSENS